ncbi:dehydratase [Ruminococcaceae bacterium OttesenSCG-928-O06]|nr:dehydratase [Ruminococcaceae bacterium OttesenSCG-928-O06]
MEYAMRGKYLEDFTVGEAFLTAARTITEADVVCFAGLTGDYTPLHTNEFFGKEHTPFGTRIAHGLLGLSIMSGLMTQTGFTEGTVLAFMQSSERFLKPILFGDTVVAKVMVKEVRPSSKPGRGVLTLTAQLLNQRDEVVTEQEQVLLMKARG